MSGIAGARFRLRQLGRVAGAGRAERFRDTAYVSDSSPVLIGGCGRSGTTLLRVMLDSHPRICCGPEGRIFNRALTRRRADSLADRFGRERAEVRGLRRECSSQAEFVERFFADFARRAGKPRWAEKTPGNVRAIPWIFEHFPQARFVHVLRDGRDTICSLRTHPRHEVVGGRLVPRNTWRPLGECIDRWTTATELGRPWRGDPRYREVRYEDLVREPEPTLRSLLDWLGEPWDDAVLRHSEVEGPTRDVTAFPQNPEAMQPVYGSSIGRWRTDLSAADAAIVEERAGPLLAELGYTPDDGWPPTGP